LASLAALWPNAPVSAARYIGTAIFSPTAWNRLHEEISTNYTDMIYAKISLTGWGS
jgi:hypothetical protein